MIQYTKGTLTGSLFFGEKFMLKDIDFTGLEIVSATRNISDFNDVKAITTAITMVREKDSLQGLEGLEKLLKETNLENEGGYVKLSCTYSLNEKNEIIHPVKIVFKGDAKYSVKVHFERDMNPSVIEDVVFVDTVFDTTESELKRVY